MYGWLENAAKSSVKMKGNQKTDKYFIDPVGYERMGMNERVINMKSATMAGFRLYGHFLFENIITVDRYDDHCRVTPARFFFTVFIRYLLY